MIFGFSSCDIGVNGGSSNTAAITLKSIAVSGTFSGVLYYVGDCLDTTGLTVIATYSDGSTKPVTGFTASVFDAVNLGTEQTITISYKEGDIIKTADVSGCFYVASAGAKLTEKPVVLTGYSGTLEGGTYYKFGDFPQTVSALTGDNAYSSSPVFNGWYLGRDGYFYAKCTENAYRSNYIYSDETKVAQLSTNSKKYFKVEPIVWRVLTEQIDCDPEGNGNKALFLAERILSSNIPYYGDIESKKNWGNTIIYPDNYKYSNIRAYLNGVNNQFVAEGGAATEYDIDWTGKGFLQIAFTSSAQKFIATTTNYYYDNYNVKHIFDDKIFLLSEMETTSVDYSLHNNGSRIRIATDFALANNACVYNDYLHWGYWWVRAELSSNRFYDIRFVDYDGFFIETAHIPCDATYVGIVPALTISLDTLNL